MTHKIKFSRLTSHLIRTAGNAIVQWEAGKGRFCIVNYHRILESFDSLLDSEPDVNTFLWQMELLAECFNVLPLHAAMQALAEQRLPPRAVCITFDDGYRSIHDLALPILKKLDLPATVFVTTGHMGQGNMWNDDIIDAIRCLPPGQLDLRDIGFGLHVLGSGEQRKRIINKLVETSKYLPPDRRLEISGKLTNLAGVATARHLMLSQEMIAHLAQEGIEIGGHTITHPILTSLDDGHARYEIIENKRQLEDIIRKPLRFFAYPNGKVNMDFDQRHAQMVREAGYVAAFTTAIGAVTHDQDRYQLPRSRPWDASPLLFGVRLLRWLGSGAR